MCVLSSQELHKKRLRDETLRFLLVLKWRILFPPSCLTRFLFSFLLYFYLPSPPFSFIPHSLPIYLFFFVSCSFSPSLSYSLLPPPFCSSPPFLLTKFTAWLIFRLRIALYCMECVRRLWTWQTRLINQTYLMKWNNLENLRKSNCQNSLKRWDCLPSF